MMEYFDVDGVPGEWERGVRLPRTFARGVWRTRYDLENFVNAAVPISKEQFDTMVADEQAAGES